MADLTSTIDDDETTSLPSGLTSGLSPLSMAAGIVNSIAQTANTPEQQQQYGNMAMDLNKRAYEHMLNKNSPLEGAGNALSSIGAVLSGIAPGGSNMFQNLSVVANQARAKQAAREMNIANELRAAQAFSLASNDPKKLSQLIGGYKATANIMQKSRDADIQEKRIQNADENAKARIANTSKMNDIREALGNKNIDVQLKKLGETHDWHGVIGQHIARKDALDERLKPLEVKLKERGLDQNEWAKYQTLSEAANIAKARMGMDYMKLNANLAAKAHETYRDKDNKIHYKIQSTDEQGQPSGEPLDIALPDWNTISSQVSEPADFKNMSDEDLVNDTLNQQPVQDQQQDPIQQAAPQQGGPVTPQAVTNAPNSILNNDPANWPKAPTNPDGSVVVPPINAAQAKAAAGLASQGPKKLSSIKASVSPEHALLLGAGVPKENLQKIPPAVAAEFMKAHEAAAKAGQTPEKINASMKARLKQLGYLGGQ